MAASRLVVIGDAHFGPGTRNADRYASLDRIIERGLRLDGLGAWLWPGDLNHGRMTIEDRNALEVRVQRMAAVAPVVITYGNHDLPGDLDSFARLAAPCPIYVIAVPEVVHIRLSTRRMLALFVLPYPQRAGLVSAGHASAFLGQEGRAALDPIFMVAGAELETARGRGDLTAMIGHVNIAGAVSSVGQPQIGKEIELDAALLDRLGNCPKVVNHIHKHQTIGDAVYPGSIARMDYGEMEPKGFLLVEFADAGGFSVAFESLEAAPMFHIEGELRPGAFTYKIVREGEASSPMLTAGAVDLFGMREIGPDELEVVNVPPDFTGADVRVRYTFRKNEIGALDKALIFAEFAGCRDLKLDAVPIVEHEIRSPAVVAAVTLEDKVVAYCEGAGLEYSGGLADKLAALLQAEPAALLADVTRSIAIDRLLAGAATRPPDGRITAAGEYVAGPTVEPFELDF